MDRKFNSKIISKYKSNSQKIRVLSEDWVGSEIFCPNCGTDILPYENNRPVADFYCKNCNEKYELKSKKNSMGRRVVDGAYKKMIERIQSVTNPNFFVLNYEPKKYTVINFAVIPKHFFVPEIIIPRQKGLTGRPNYIMCSIDLTNIPESGKIFYIKNGQVETKENVLKNWQRTLFLRETKKTELKGWILDVMKCVDKINKPEFSLQEMYNFENILAKKYPENKHVKDKIRQQLQFLRDKGYLEFLGNGKYKLT